MKKKILFVGEHPFGFSGNSHMLNAILQCINPEVYDYSVFAVTNAGVPSLAEDPPCHIIEGGTNPKDLYGHTLLLQVLQGNKIDVLIFVGLDLWTYSGIYSQLTQLKKQQKFIWCNIFPYDAHFVRKDWISLLAPIDIPCVYSQYGYNLLKQETDRIFYFRPPLFDSDKFVPYSEEKRKEFRRSALHIEDDKFIFGFFGHNQFRKDPLRLIHAFYEVKKEFPNIGLYFHSEKTGVFNIDQYLLDCNGKMGDFYIKKQHFVYSTDAVVKAYNMVDCYVNVSLQEGLSWTVLEAMLCGIPCMISDSTAHKELAEGGAAVKIPSTDLAYFPVGSYNGQSTFLESRACNVPSLVYLMKNMITQEKLRKQCVEKGMHRAKEWLAGISNITDIIEEAYKLIDKPVFFDEKKKIEKILFMQHSSAGDIFMTTRCLKAIKERHNLPLVYMTQKKYQDILVNNPYVDEIIDWDETVRGSYKYSYNPHGDKILPGSWGRNSNSILSDFYWKVLRIEPCDFFIEKKEIDFPFPKEMPVMIVHTTGGDPAFRTYKYMGDVCKAVRGKYFTIQVGSRDDFPAGADYDLRGKLSFRETAYVVSKAKIAVTVDSFISHLCGALGVSQVCLFGSGNRNVVMPNQVSGTLICMEPDYINNCKGLGPCSAAVRDCPTPCTGIHDPKTIIENIYKIEGEINYENLMRL